MPEMNAPRAEGSIFTHSLDDYREKVGEIIRKENEKFTQLAQDQAKQIIDNAWSKAEEIIGQSQKKAAEIVAESEQKAAGVVADSQKNALRVGSDIERQANEHAAEIIEKAQLKSRQIIQEAEESAKKDAKARVKSQEEKILTRARDEADSIVTDARKNAERESSLMMEKLKKDAEQRLEEETTKFRAEAQVQIAQVRNDAEKKAAEIVNDIIQGSNEVNQMIIETIKRSEGILEKFKGEMQVQVGELTKGAVTARQKLEQKINALAGKSDDETLLQKINGNSVKDQALLVTLKGEQMAQRGNGNYLFKGQMELKTLSAIDYLQVRKLKGFLIQVPNMKYLGESSSEEGTILLFEMKEPLPLMDILNNIPLVGNVVAQGDNLKLILN